MNQVAWAMPALAEEVLMSRAPLIAPERWDRGPVLDHDEVMRRLPHREQALLIDRVTHVDRERDEVVAVHDLGRHHAVFAGHFPGHPVFPAVLQAEAIAQAGAMSQGVEPGEVWLMSHILGARFFRAVGPEAGIRLLARVISDGWFDVVVGQCWQEGQLCSAAAIAGLRSTQKGS